MNTTSTCSHVGTLLSHSNHHVLRCYMPVFTNNINGKHSVFLTCSWNAVNSNVMSSLAPTSGFTGNWNAPQLTLFSCSSWPMLKVISRFCILKKGPLPEAYDNDGRSSSDLIKSNITDPNARGTVLIHFFDSRISYSFFVSLMKSKRIH